ncbi:hypothetical protein ACFCYM_09895 [Streptomyces sp. NPDC056254]|uniref:hypothetical protein n=1 Tax=Streptomyces sp. NPDC056254 TaxID=3345763 RepID=UPI0035E0A085
MTHDSTLPVPTIDPPRTVQAAALLNRLVLRAERDRDLATLMTALYWTIPPVGPNTLSGSLYPYSSAVGHKDHGQRLLDLAAALFGGTPADEGERYDDKYTWHQLKFTYGGLQVTLRAAVHNEVVEQRLRARIAELEAAAAAGQAVNQ